MEDERKNTLAQKAARLDNLMDEKAPPTIYSTKLTPELSEAALNLTIDFQRQKKSGVTTRMIQHPYTILIVLTAFVTYGSWSLGGIIVRHGFMYLRWHWDDLMGTLVFTTMFTCVVFHFLNRPAEVIRDNADKLVEDSTPVFGFDIKEFAAIKAVDPKKLDKEQKEMLKTAENTSIVIYRDTPIAVVSLVPVEALTKKDLFVTKVTGVGIRKVYWRSGIIEDLFDWAVYRSGVLNNSKAPKILVCVEVVSTDHELKKVLKSKSFQYIEERPIGDSIILKTYGVNFEIWGLSLNVSKLDNVEKVKAKVGTTGAKRRA